MILGQVQFGEGGEEADVRWDDIQSVMAEIQLLEGRRSRIGMTQSTRNRIEPKALQIHLKPLKENTD